MRYKVPYSLNSTPQSSQNTSSSPENFPTIEALSVQSELHEVELNMDTDTVDRQQSVAGTTTNLSVEDVNTLTNFLNVLKEAPPEA
ncbi:putative eka-like protein [Golovinomyces cichoracearum]|uniref:Putative eka-like protein n=1 Tax=Golovinomyces cichoracearum TaxID=62708 RepID=A0A420IVB5_9PEZI|nr:putative eka-like protein [Golovinomyces cichoracearum]